MGREISKPNPSDELRTQVYRELRVLAAQQMASERNDHTLQPTALVHEAWARLQNDGAARPDERALFFHAAAEAMRRILIEHARKKKRLKRGVGWKRMPASLDDLVLDENSDRVLAVDEAIGQIEEEDPRVAEVIRLRFFAGLTFEQTAETLDVSERTVHREWSYARARMAQLLSDT